MTGDATAAWGEATAAWGAEATAAAWVTAGVFVFQLPLAYPPFLIGDAPVICDTTSDATCSAAWTTRSVNVSTGATAAAFQEPLA